MSLHNWLKRWMIAALLCFALLAGCSIYGAAYLSKYRLAANSNDVINQARLNVNAVLVYLEQHIGELPLDSHIQETLKLLCEDNGIRLMYAGLDGTVVFDSAMELTAAKIDLKTSLHYDLYYAKQKDGLYKIAFPIMDEAGQLLVGNAIFTLPVSKVLIAEPNRLPAVLFVVTLATSGLFVLMLLSLRFNFQHHFIAPLHRLKRRAEAILKGNYEEKSSYAKMDELGELYATFDQMRLEIKHLSMQRLKQEQAQKELITNISHDIKTPLTTVKAYIDAILDGVASDREAMLEYVEVMRSNADKMAGLVDDLLIHALQELGEISVNLKEQYSKPALEAILQPLGHYVRTNGLVFRTPADIPDVLLPLDAARMEQVISNIVSNAVKHTASGDTISMDITLGIRQLTITIADTGQGILPQDMPFIFERYYRGQADPDSDSSLPQGHGLGLSICKTIIEAHGGTIAFKSIRGQGTTFHFTLPLG
ncbi:sensor histidine kinase [Paenibacillaceae bacterium]|nr:sensor histidine kinase [Paenibacillaceae bacterium]